MPEQPTKPVDPLTANPIKAQPVSEPFKQATGFSSWNDREMAKVATERADGAAKHAAAYMKARVDKATGKPAHEHKGPGGAGKTPSNTPTVNAPKVNKAKEQYDARMERIGKAKDSIFRKIETGQYKPRVLSQVQIDHADREKRAASLKTERDFAKAARGDERTQFNRAARGR